jgi:hypothetical protein
MNFALRVTASAECAKSTAAAVIQETLGQYAAGGIAGAQKEYVVDVVGHV